MADPVKPILVYPRPGVTIHLPGGIHGFKSGPVPMHPDHAKALAAHVVTEEERAPQEGSRAHADIGAPATDAPIVR